MAPRPVPTLLALALAATAAAAEGGGSEGSFEECMERGRETAARALATGEPAAARDAYEAFLAAGARRPSDPEPFAEAGLLALALGDGAHASRMLAAIRAAAPESAALRFLRGSLHLARGDFEDALHDFRASKAAGYRAAASEDRVFESTLGRGFALLEAYDFEGAVAALRDATALRPRHPLVARARLATALAYRSLRSPKEAERVLRDCIETFPTFGPAYGELGDLCADLGRHEEALAVLGRAARVDPDYAGAHFLRAWVLTLSGRLAEAEAAFAEFHRRSPPTGESESRYGTFLRRKGEPAKALETLRRALTIDPGRIPVLYEISLCLRDLGRERDAAAALEVWKKAEEAQRARAHGGPGAKGEEPEEAEPRAGEGGEDR